ncbi:DNA-binding protein [Isosphaeraceae bacterium EP7]
MAQFYTLEEAARVLGMSPEELKVKAQHREVRAFMDGGTWQFRVADVDELARRRGLGSDPELSLSDLDLDIPAGSDSHNLDLSEFQLGVVNPDLGPPTVNLSADSGDDLDILLDETTLPPGPSSGSSSTILGMKPSGKRPSDSDVRLVPDLTMRGSSDSDVRLSPQAKMPSDSDVTLISDISSDDLAPVLPGSRSGDTSFQPSPSLGSSDELHAIESDSDFELSSPSSNLIDALQPESGSDFELTALDASSDEFEATPLSPADSDVTAAEPSLSGINLGRPSDSGINLLGPGAFDLSQADSIELAPLDGDEPAPKAPPRPVTRPAAAAAPKAPDKDIFEDTDFEVDALGTDESGDDRTVQLEAASDFELEDSDSASEVFAIDEDDVDQNAATAMAPALLEEEDDEDAFGDLGGAAASGDSAGSGWDVEREDDATGSRAAPAAMMASSASSAEWGGLWVGVLGAAAVFTLVLALVSLDLVRNLYEFRGDTPASGLIRSLAGLVG